MFGGNSFSQFYFAQPGAVYSTVSHSLTKGLKYTVKVAPTALTKSLKYCVKVTPTAATKSLHYLVKAPTALTKSLKYCIKTTGFLSTGFDGGFGGLSFASNFFGQADSFVQKSQNIKQAALGYSVKAPHAMTKSLKYTVKITRSAITKSLTYHVSPLIQKSLKYTLKTARSVTRLLEYAIRTQGYALQKQLQYEVQAAGFMDLYTQQNTPYGTSDLYVPQGTPFTNLY